MSTTTTTSTRTQFNAVKRLEVSHNETIEPIRTSLESVLSTLLPGVPVTTNSHFFDDLGADSMTMARFCARVRKDPQLPDVSMRDVYAHPTLEQLAVALRLSPEGADEPAAAVEPVREPQVVPASSRAMVLTGIAQALFFIGYSFLLTLGALQVFAWSIAATSPFEVYLRAALSGGGLFLAACLTPVVAKWVLIGRWTPRRIKVWSPGYLRFWIVKSLLQASPMVVFVGNPVYVLYLRALGVRIGRGAAIFSRQVPVAADLISVGAAAIIRKECMFHGYRAEAGEIIVGPVRIGDRAFVGEKTVLDTDTALGDDSQLGHSSSLRPGEQVPSGQRYHGIPAVRTDVDYQRVPTAGGGRVRRLAISAITLLQLVLFSVPVTVAGIYLLVEFAPQALQLQLPYTFETLPPWFEALTVSIGGVLLIGTVGLGLVMTVPKLLGTLIRPGVDYPLHGFHHALHRFIQISTNLKIFVWFFGDSSFIVGYLRRLGYRMTEVVQTGSNFGTAVQHETPYQVEVGTGTMVADGLSLLNADFSATHFRVTRAQLGANSFLGNHIAYPSGARIGSNCLLATKVMIPLDGAVRENTGLLGSPPFEIPRTVERDASHRIKGEELSVALRAKNRMNLRSMALMVAARTLDTFLIALMGFVVLGHAGEGPSTYLLIAVFAPAVLLIQTVFWIAVERLLLRHGPLEPKLCSIYDPYFWWHERLWKVPVRYQVLFNGTPFKPLIWRLLGVRIGRRVFDDGVVITERSLTAIGDDATLNFGSVLQNHSQEDGTFKSDHIRLGAGVTLGVAAFIHYGVSIGDHAVVDADAFVMKGEEIPDQARWAGNPASPATTAAGRSAGTARTVLDITGGPS